MRGATASVLTVASAVVAQSCSFPQHTFSDRDFYGTTGAGGDASPSGNGGSGNPGSGATAGGGGSSGSFAGGGMGGTGGTVIMVMREGGRTPPREAGSSGGSGTGGAEPDSGPKDSGPACATGLSQCGTQCFDFLRDNQHCGNCTTGCTAPDICTGGTCAPPCASGLTDCNGTCSDLNSDENHCGTCAKKCSTNQICDTGTCVINCAPLSRCGTSCYDFTTDQDNCGGCASPCASTQKCSGGTCKANCTLPFVDCGGCVNTQTDPTHCGNCSTACGAQQGCVAGGCVNLVENCQNGIDDDNNGLVDCADPACTAGYSCARTPSGWTGPIALWVGAPGKAPACSGSGSYGMDLLDAHGGLTNPSYTCPACNCAPVAGSNCAPLTFYYDQSTLCTDSTAWEVTAPEDGTCQQWVLDGAKPSAHSSQLENPPSSYASGSCGANQATPSFPAPGWTQDVEMCGNPATSGGGCTQGQCVPNPKAPFGTKVCIYTEGIATCPSDYPVQTPATSQFYESYSDPRTCSTCNCGSPTCGGTVHTFTDLNCTANGTVVAIDGTCTTIPIDPTQGGSGYPQSADTRSVQWDNGGPVCGNVPSQLQGAPKPESPITVCCQSP